MATTHLYSLTDHILTITPSNNADVSKPLWNSIGGNAWEIGGTDSMIGQIRVSRPTDTWSTEGDATGGFVHNKNYNRTGRVSVSIRQVSDTITRLLKLADSYFAEDGNMAEDIPLQLEIKDSRNNKVIVRAKSAFLTKPADQAFGERATQQDWVFTCGEIDYYPA